MMKIAVTLLAAVLVAQSSGFVVQTRKDDTTTVPGFSYSTPKTADHEQLAMSTSKGEIAFIPSAVNTTAWKFTPKDGSPAISQETRLALFAVNYYNVYISAGDESDVGMLYFYYGDSTFTITLVATGNKDDCTLKAEISAPKLGNSYEAVFRGMDDVSDAFRVGNVLKELRAKVWGTMVGVLPKKLSVLVTKGLKEVTDVKQVCVQLLEATENNFPEPDLQG